MKLRYTTLIIILMISVMLIASTAWAQDIKTEGKVNQVYINIGNDVRCYEILYETKNTDYINYYKAIREKIVQTLKDLYRYYYKRGDVNLLFTLKSDGSLARFDVDSSKSTADKKLIGIATLSLKQASPFPPFPKDLPSQELSFNVIISFREK